MRLARCAWPGAKIAPMRRATPSGSPHALNRVLPVFFLPTNLFDFWKLCCRHAMAADQSAAENSPLFTAV